MRRLELLKIMRESGNIGIYLLTWAAKYLIFRGSFKINRGSGQGNLQRGLVKYVENYTQKNFCAFKIIEKTVAPA